MNRMYDELAWVYDAAFSWPVDEEVDWLLARFGSPARRLLEVGCGSGRFMPALACRGVEVVGVDRSASMLARARERMKTAGLRVPRLKRADMSGFSLSITLDGAFCAINTFGYLGNRVNADAHLDCIHRHLRERGRYLVQLELRSLTMPGSRRADSNSQWEVESAVGRVRCTWSGLDVDTERRVEKQMSRFEIITGEHAGEVYEEVHEMRLWDWKEWQDLVHGAQFEQLAAYDGRSRSRPRLSLERGLNDVPLVWHELIRL